jgi:hypothetical protein
MYQFRRQGGGRHPIAHGTEARRKNTAEKAGKPNEEEKIIVDNGGATDESVVVMDP